MVLEKCKSLLPGDHSEKHRRKKRKIAQRRRERGVGQRRQNKKAAAGVSSGGEKRESRTGTGVPCPYKIAPE
jgi:hypothetical protein